MEYSLAADTHRLTRITFYRFVGGARCTAARFANTPYMLCAQNLVQCSPLGLYECRLQLLQGHCRHALADGIRFAARIDNIAPLAGQIFIGIPKSPG